MNTIKNLRIWLIKKLEQLLDWLEPTFDDDYADFIRIKDNLLNNRLPFRVSLYFDRDWIDYYFQHVSDLDTVLIFCEQWLASAQLGITPEVEQKEFLLKDFLHGS